MRTQQHDTEKENLSLSSLRSVDLNLIEQVMRGEAKGYVLDFSNRTFGDFFVRELDIDIDAPIYATNGTSKGKRLGCILGKVDDQTATRTLSSTIDGVLCGSLFHQLMLIIKEPVPKGL